MREILCRCCGRPDVAGWLRTKGINVKPQLEAQLNSVITYSGRRIETRELLGGTFRARVKKKGLPKPLRWACLANALSAVRAIRANPDLGLTRIATRLGYADSSAIRHMLSREFGLSVAQARDVGGYPLEILVERWWARSQQNAAAKRRKAA